MGKKEEDADRAQTGPSVRTSRAASNGTWRAFINLSGPRALGGTLSSPVSSPYDGHCYLLSYPTTVQGSM